MHFRSIMLVFRFQGNAIINDVSDYSSEWFEFDFSKTEYYDDPIEDESFVFEAAKSKSYMARKDINDFLDQLLQSLTSLYLREKDIDIFFSHFSILISKLTSAIFLMSQQNDGTDILSAVSSVSDYVMSRLSEVSSQFKRRKKIEKLPNYVHAQDKAIGTRFVMVRDKSSDALITQRIQSTLQFNPLTDTIKSMFQD